MTVEKLEVRYPLNVVTKSLINFRQIKSLLMLPLLHLSILIFVQELFCHYNFKMHGLLAAIGGVQQLPVAFGIDYGPYCFAEEAAVEDFLRLQELEESELHHLSLGAE